MLDQLILAWRRLGSRVHIALAFWALAVVLFIAVGVASGRQAQRQIERDAGAALEQVAERLAFGLSKGLYERWREIQTLAALDALLPTGADAPHWRALLQHLQRSASHFSWIGVADADGRVIAGTDGLLEGGSVAARPWFRQGLAQPMVGDLHDAVLLARLLPPTASGEPLRLLDFAAPLRRDGQVHGVLGAHLNWQWVHARRDEVLSKLDAERGIQLVVLGRDGGVLLGPVGGRPTPPLPATLPPRGAAGFVGDDGRRYLAAPARDVRYASELGLGWTVMALQPQDIALAAAQRTQQLIWCLAAAAALAFGGAGWWLAGLLTRRLRAAARRARQLAAPAQAPARDEVALLSGALDALLERVQTGERELGDLGATLEARVAQRTDALRQVNADLQSFSRSVSHDLKGPIGSIGLVLRNVLEHDAAQLDASSRRMLGAVAGECDRLRLLIDELLTLAMVEQRELRSEAVPMQPLVQTVLSELRAAPPAGVRAEAEVAVGDLPTVRGDPVLLRQVWHNLIGNALKFSARAGAPRIEVGAVAQGDEVVFSVTDNGAGFDPSQAGRLFGVFQRLHRASDYPGTGVGLSIVKRVVHRHGGRVWAEPRPEGGARFYFALPGQVGGTSP